MNTQDLKSGKEAFLNMNQVLDFNLSEFWRWAFSDIMNNTVRGILAEFLVAKALGIELDQRSGWDTFDLKTLQGIKLEIKSSAYIQSWEQKDYSKISFGISPTKLWNPSTGLYEGVPERRADIYIFCLLKNKDHNSINPLDVSQWEFYVLPTQRLNEKSLTQTSITLGSLKKLSPEIFTFETLKNSSHLN